MTKKNLIWKPDVEIGKFWNRKISTYRRTGPWCIYCWHNSFIANHKIMDKGSPDAIIFPCITLNSPNFQNLFHLSFCTTIKPVRRCTYRCTVKIWQIDVHSFIILHFGTKLIWTKTVLKTVYIYQIWLNPLWFPPP